MKQMVVALLACVVGGSAWGANIYVRESVPRRWLNNVLPENLPPLEFPAYANQLDHARIEAFAGRYKKALMTLNGIKDADPVQVALIRATSLAATGRRDQALSILSQADVVNSPQVQIQTASILAELGKCDEAIKLIKQHLDKNPNSIAGHYWLGTISEQVGDTTTALKAFEWFIIDPQNFLEKWQRQRDRGFDNAEELTLIGRSIDRWATLSGSYQSLPQLPDALSSLFIRTYDVIDRTYWPAHVAAAEYFLAHDNVSHAVDDLVEALKANPNDIHLHDLLGHIAVDQWNFDAADQQIDAIRQVDSHSLVADLLEARNMLQQRRPANAARPIERVLAQQPNNLEAIGLLAATYALRLQDDKTTELLKRAEALDADNSSAYFEVAEQLGAMRQYPRSEAMYKVAIDRAPWSTAARNGLGLLYTQSGDEDAAKTTLDAAHALDPFNLRTTNYLRLLDQLQGFARKETAHFVVMYDAKLDPMIPEYFGDYLESIHADVCGEYKTEPSVKTYIEVFPTHDAFSVRTTGSPWIGTVGASTGRVIAMVAPRKGEATMGPFNWSQVLRHEFTHTVTLAATDNRIPHWMTEGLAVSEELSPLKWEWVPMLYEAVTKHELFPLDTLTWGFVRPQKPTDRSLAYAESFWICTYITKTYSHDAILKMLAEFKNGASEADAFQKVLGKSQADFQVEFFAWAAQQVAGWGYDLDTSAKYDELKEKGEEQIKASNYISAVTTWEQIAKMRPVDALPHQRLAGLYLTSQVNQPAKAIEHLKALHDVELKDNRFAKRIARIYRDIKEYPSALNYAMQAVYIDPYDLDAHNLLLEVGTKEADQSVIDREKRVIPVLTAWLDANRPKPMPN